MAFAMTVPGTLSRCYWHSRVWQLKRRPLLRQSGLSPDVWIVGAALRGGPTSPPNSEWQWPPENRLQKGGHGVPPLQVSPSPKFNARFKSLRNAGGVTYGYQPPD